MHHPDNVAACCKYQNNDYCTCIIQETLDCNAQPYDGVGAWANSVVYSTPDSVGRTLSSARAVTCSPYHSGSQSCVGTV